MKNAGLLLCMLIVLSFVSGIAEGATWQRISVYEDTTIYIDNDSIKHISQTITEAQFKIVFTKPSWVKSKSIDYYLIEQENNCSKNKYKVYQVNLYFSDGTNETFKIKEEQDVNPDTFQSVIHEFMCKDARIGS